MFFFFFLANGENFIGLCFVIQGTKVIDTWFLVDVRPFKQALLTTVKKWSFMFKQHLIDHIKNRSVKSALHMHNVPTSSHNTQICAFSLIAQPFYAKNIVWICYYIMFVTAMR